MVKDLAALFRNPLRIRVLAYVLRTLLPATAVQVAKALRAPRAGVMRELSALTKLGVTALRPPRAAPHYQVVESHTLVPNLRILLAEAMNPSDAELLVAFRGVPGILFLVATGVLAHDDRGAVDLLIVCKNPHSIAIPRAVARVERVVGLPLRYTVMGLAEYMSRRQSFDRVLRDVLDFSHRILIARLPQGGEAPLG